MGKALCFFWSSADNTDANPNNIIFTVKDTKLDVPILSLLARDNEKLLKLLSKGFDRYVCCNEYITRTENEKITHECRYFLESKFFGVYRLFVLVYTNQEMTILKD